MRDHDIAHRLHDLCLGSGDPSQALLDSGRFPDGWVGTYLGLLDEAVAEWGDSPVLPRQLVGSVLYASWYLPIRYQAWRQRSGQQLTETEGDLATIRTPSAVFLLSSK